MIPSAARLGLAVAGLVFLLDQISKSLILDMFANDPRGVEVLPFFNLVLAWNRGVSFGMFGGGTVPAWGLAVVSFAICGVLLVWMFRSAGRWTTVSLGLVIGGAIGNVIDRFMHGAVVDFLDFHVAGTHWPAFNVADSAITVGVVLLVVESLFSRPEASK